MSVEGGGGRGVPRVEFAAGRRSVADVGVPPGAGARGAQGVPGRGRGRAARRCTSRCPTVKSPYPRPGVRRGAGAGPAIVTVTAHTLVRDLLLQADRLDAGGAGRPGAGHAAARGTGHHRGDAAGRLRTRPPPDPPCTAWSPVDDARRPRVTIKDVAARAGVSKGAVSLAFNHKPGLSEATRDRIFRAAPGAGLGAEPRPRGRWPGRGWTSWDSRSAGRPGCSGSNPSTWSSSPGVESVLTEHSCSLLLRLVRNLEEEVGLQESWWRARQIGGSILVDFRRGRSPGGGGRAARACRSSRSGTPR